MNTITDALQPFVDRNELAGAVTLVATREKTLGLDTVGFADIAARTPMHPDTLFWIASMTKPITGTAFMMLVDEGKVNLDDPVETYLPEFSGQTLAEPPGARPSRPMTLRDTLRHTSGLPFASPEEAPTLDALLLADAVRTYARLPLQSEPGTRYAYSNAGINTAARVLEVVSGVSYETFLQTRLLDPLGMTDTAFVPTDAQSQRLARAYMPDAAGTGLAETPISQLQYPLTDPRRCPMPAGGLFSTARDVARFSQMVLNGGEPDGKRFVSEMSVGEMTKKQTADAITECYGLGWSTSGGSFGHGGALATNMTIDPAHGLILLFLVQHNGFPGDGAKSLDAFQEAARARFNATAMRL